MNSCLDWGATVRSLCGRELPITHAYGKWGRDLSSEKKICIKMLGYGVLHLFICYIALYNPEKYSHTRAFPMVYLAMVFGPIAFAIENCVGLYLRREENE